MARFLDTEIIDLCPDCGKKMTHFERQELVFDGEKNVFHRRCAICITKVGGSRLPTSNTTGADPHYQ